MYAAMSFERGGEPDWQAQAEVFAPNARLVRVREDGVFEFDPQSFRADYERMIRTGEVPSLYERELSRDTKVFNNIAHVLSEYELRTSREGAFISRAIKSIQLFERGGRWWISAMIWRRLA
ncbi:MAG TPA: hypothetical protein VI258_07265 [Rhodanobacteraceae bacterium]